MRISRRLFLAGAVLVVVVFVGRSRMVEAIFGMAGAVRGLDTSIHFYGRVLDQDDRPVEGAVVAAGIRHFSLVSTYFMGSKKLEVATDPGGFFEISGYRGSDLFIGGISKDGYVAVPGFRTLGSCVRVE